MRSVSSAYSLLRFESIYTKCHTDRQVLRSNALRILRLLFADFRRRRCRRLHRRIWQTCALPLSLFRRKHSHISVLYFGDLLVALRAVVLESLTPSQKTGQASQREEAAAKGNTTTTSQAI